MFGMPGSRTRPLPRQRDLPGYQISASVTSGNNLIIGLNQTQGADPFIEFRDPNIANGGPYFRPIPNGAQFVINSGNTMGASNATAFRLWILGFDNGGGISPAAINCTVLPTQVVRLDESSVQSPTGGNGGSTAGTFFCAQSLTSRPFRILGYLEWSSGLATAGTWNVKPTKIQLFGPGIGKPGEIVQQVRTDSGAVANGATQIPYDDTIPQITEGNQYLSQAITPSSAANLLRTECQAWLNSNGAARLTAALYNTTYDAANALAAMTNSVGLATDIRQYNLSYVRLANTGSATTYTMRAGNNAAVTTTFNGENTARMLGGVINSYIQIYEIMG